MGFVVFTEIATSCFFMAAFAMRVRNCIPQISRTKGLISEDRNNKATLLLTIPRPVFKSSAKDLIPPNIWNYDSGVNGWWRALSRPPTLIPIIRCKGFRPIGITPKYREAKCTAMSSMDSGLEAFSHNPTDGSFAALAVRPTANAKYLNQRFLSY